MIARLKIWAQKLKRDVLLLYVAGRDPRTPLLVKTIAIVVAAYALSPIDFIPDFIPIIGYIDDLIIVPIGIMLAIKLMPVDLLDEFRQTATHLGKLPTNRIVVGVILFIWGALLITLLMWAYGWFVLDG
jgi:uncharacterized membrane protein YkvA (DUF1232 family)